MSTAFGVTGAMKFTVDGAARQDYNLSLEGGLA
jgi:hypothetical protein